MGSDSKSNGSGGGGGGGGASGNSQIPAAVKKIVQNLREIVDNNSTDSEIYAVLKECDMDPNEAVQRLLSQDTFREVKSKRERRKEQMKETQDSKARANNSSSNYGVRVGAEHSSGRSGSTQMGSNELGKVAYRREGASVASLPYSTSTYRATGKILTEQPFSQCESFNADNRRQPIGTGDIITSSVLLSSGFQPSWVGAAVGHVSMADVVKMGRPQSKDSQASGELHYTSQDAVPPNSVHNHNKSSHISLHSQPERHQDLHSPNVEPSHESGKSSGQHDFENDWPVVDQVTAASGPHALDTSGVIGARVSSNQPYLYSDRSNLSRNCQSDKIQLSDRGADRNNITYEYTGSDPGFSQQTMVNGAGGTSKNDDVVFTDMTRSDSYGYVDERLEETVRGSHLSVPSQSTSLPDDVNNAVTATAMNLQQLSLGKEEQTVSRTEDNHGLVLPNYLQAFAADCSHLSFGTYKSGKSSAISRPQISSHLTSELQDTSVSTDGLPAMHMDPRNSVIPGDKVLGFTHDAHRATSDIRNYDPFKSSQAEIVKQDISEATYGQEYMYHLSAPDSNFKNHQQWSSSLTSVMDHNSRDLGSLPSQMSYSNSIPSDLLAMRARDSAAFLTAQSVPSRYGAAIPSINSPTISMSEVMNSAASKALPGANLANSRSQVGYHGVPQSYPYMPSALQQTYQNGTALHDSLTSMKYNQHYRTGASTNGLPLSSSSTSGYGSYGSSSNIPGSFLHDLSIPPMGSKVGYNDVLHAQLKDGNNFTLQQSDNTGLWDYGPGSRNIATTPDDAYYSLLGQYQQLAGHRQAQQQHSQQQGALGYPSMYSSQTGIPEEHQQQSLRDLILSNSQGPSSKQLHQFWQHIY